jgi:hypothetical protein
MNGEGPPLDKNKLVRQPWVCTRPPGIVEKLCEGVDRTNDAYQRR